jgi:hypothetical protein
MYQMGRVKGHSSTWILSDFSHIQAKKLTLNKLETIKKACDHLMQDKDIQINEKDHPRSEARCVKDKVQAFK